MRFRLRSLLAGLFLMTALTAGMVKWLNWPERTARRWAARQPTMTLDEVSKLTPLPRSVADCFLGRQSFDVVRKYDRGFGLYQHRINVVRGEIMETRKLKVDFGGRPSEWQ